MTPTTWSEPPRPVAPIIEAANDRSWIADDSGLWEGMVYGTLAAVAFFSLENLIHSALEAAGVDTNDDFPFASKEEVETD